MTISAEKNKALKYHSSLQTSASPLLYNLRLAVKLTLSHQLTHKAVNFPGWLSWQCTITLSVTSIIILAVHLCVSHSFNDDRPQNSVKVLIDNFVDRSVLLAYNLKLPARIAVVSVLRYLSPVRLSILCTCVLSWSYNQPSARERHMVDLEWRICLYRPISIIHEVQSNPN